MPRLPEGYAEKVARSFPGVVVEWCADKERWQFVKILEVQVYKPRKTLIVVPGAEHPTETVDNFWVLHVCETPEGGYRPPNERDLEALHAVSLYHHRGQDITRRVEEKKAALEKKEERDDEDFYADLLKEMQTAVDLDENVPFVPGAELNGKEEPDAPQSDATHQ